jgi:hypothetical protein
LDANPKNPPSRHAIHYSCRFRYFSPICIALPLHHRDAQERAFAPTLSGHQPKIFLPRQPDAALK